MCGPSPRRRPPCVSVGVATWLTLRDLHRHVGLSSSSWALHGDNGQLYHGCREGSSFKALLSRAPVCEGPGSGSDGSTANCNGSEPVGPDDTAAASTRKPPTFGAGDVLGCGSLALTDGCIGIFFTLNGHFLGVCYLVRARAEPQLWPCVSVHAHWDLDFNFGASRFMFDLDSLHVSQLVPRPFMFTLNDVQDADESREKVVGRQNYQHR
ncbi:unnamed protein product [Polarella glacialis]|uniref:SPRY domain-containing protein n=1 Tax=Polarella glacialis TaxID=89957 RepID=A0A813GA44_POLGL|nr:unnamed protein product [Polarella glacialis]CAE8655914.1 unnamed protein product [Polarella glacialis]